MIGSIGRGAEAGPVVLTPETVDAILRWVDPAEAEAYGGGCGRCGGSRRLG